MQNASQMCGRVRVCVNANVLSTLRRVAVISALRAATNKNRLKNRMTAATAAAAAAPATTLNNNNHV